LRAIAPFRNTGKTLVCERQRTDLNAEVGIASASDTPTTLTDAIDAIERIREELLVLERALEKIEPAEAIPSAEE
jgi:hypothetical protein